MSNSLVFPQWPTIGAVLLMGANALAQQPDVAIEPEVRGASAADPAGTNPQFKTESLRGRVVFLGPALKQRYGVNVMPESRERVLALRTLDGPLIPLVEDLRGRSFRTDPRLRQMNVELFVRRYAGLPMLQVLQIYEVTADGTKAEVDYWCDVCSIVMFEDGPCACCQDHNRLRKRAVDER